MTFQAIQAVRAQLERDEGFKAFIYVDTRGRRTIGYGCNLDAGITLAQAGLLLECRLNDAIRDVARLWRWSATLDDVRLGVLLQLEVNIGLAGEAKFVQLLGALERRDYDAAAGALIDSAADHEEPARIMRWAQELKTGVQL
jgi:GH24 family phage-related lysozyme (muramidase)